jgi:hemerythrin-like domain-containing protein
MIKNFIPTFIDSANKLIQSLDKHDDKENLDIFKFISRCSLTAILATSFGLSATEVEFDDEILKAVEE